MHFSLAGPSINSTRQQVQKRLGQSYLQENRIEEALNIFLEILADDPADTDTLLVIANLYRTSGSMQTAMTLYHYAWKLCPENMYIQSQMAALKGCQSTTVEELQPLIPAAIARLLERLQNLERIGQIEEIRTAANMLDRFIPGNLSEGDVQQLMPAFIEWNMRHARASGQTDLADALQSLHNHLNHMPVVSRRGFSDEGNGGTSGSQQD